MSAAIRCPDRTFHEGAAVRCPRQLIFLPQAPKYKFLILYDIKVHYTDNSVHNLYFCIVDSIVGIKKMTNQLYFYHEKLNGELIYEKPWVMKYYLLFIYWIYM